MYISYLLVFLQFSSLALLFYPISSEISIFAEVFSVICLSLSFSLLLWTSKHNKLGNFNIVPEIKEGGTLIQTGPYAYVRHPMYTSVILIGLAALVYSFTGIKILVFLLLVFVLVLKAKREEGFWCDENKEYQAYSIKTKMFIPFIL